MKHPKRIACGERMNRTSLMVAFAACFSVRIVVGRFNLLYPLTGFRFPSVAVLFPASHRFTAFRCLS